MLKPVAEGVFVHESEFLQTNTVVVRGAEGVLVIDAGITVDEIACLASDLRELGEPVVAGFSTHPHWDHLLWSAGLGTAPRYGTTQAAEAIQARRADPDWRALVGGMIPDDLTNRVLLDDTFGRITALTAPLIPWAGPEVRIVEHQAHAPGHAALVIEERGVLVAGDMLSDVLIPMLSPFAADPIGDYLQALNLLETAGERVDVVIPGHGSVGASGEMLSRIVQDRAYVNALRDGVKGDDSRLGVNAKPGWEWLEHVHAGQVERIRG